MSSGSQIPSLTANSSEAISTIPAVVSISSTSSVLLRPATMLVVGCCISVGSVRDHSAEVAFNKTETGRGKINKTVEFGNCGYRAGSHVLPGDTYNHGVRQEPVHAIGVDPPFASAARRSPARSPESVDSESASGRPKPATFSSPLTPRSSTTTRVESSFPRLQMLFPRVEYVFGRFPYRETVTMLNTGLDLDMQGAGTFHRTCPRTLQVPEHPAAILDDAIWAASQAPTVFLEVEIRAQPGHRPCCPPTVRRATHHRHRLPRPSHRTPEPLPAPAAGPHWVYVWGVASPFSSFVPRHDSPSNRPLSLNPPIGGWVVLW